MFFGGFRQISAYFGHWVYFGLSSNPLKIAYDIMGEMRAKIESTEA